MSCSDHIWFHVDIEAAHRILRQHGSNVLKPGAHEQDRYGFSPRHVLLAAHCWLAEAL